MKIKETVIERENAIRFLEAIGWNTYGAEAIVDTAIEDGVELTESNLISLSEDYRDR